MTLPVQLVEDSLPGMPGRQAAVGLEGLVMSILLRQPAAFPPPSVGNAPARTDGGAHGGPRAG